MLYSLGQINAVSPYLVGEYNDGTVSFITDKGIEYWISFIEETNIGLPNAYQLVLSNKSQSKVEGTDNKIAETMTSILRSFFENEEHILFYICDTSDRHEAARHRKFTSWYNRYADQNQLALATEIIAVEDSTFYISVIYRKNEANEQKVVPVFHSYFQELRSKLE